MGPLSCQFNFFNDNLSTLYEKHAYLPHQVWKCDELGAQVGRGGGGFVLAKRDTRNVHVVVHDQHEW